MFNLYNVIILCLNHFKKDVIKLKNETYTYFHLKELPLKASFYRCQSTPLNKTVVYFHGGGLIYGSRDDISEDIIQSFLNAGYHFLTFDYPLAPESELKVILSSVKEAVRWFNKESTQSLSIDSSDYILFGRSAGAYLCFQIAGDPSLKAPNGIIDFYGYHSLQYKAFQEPSAYYSNYPTLTKKVVNKIIQSHPVSSGSLQSRFALYLYARQTGKWMELLNVCASDISQYELSEKTLRALPPTFIAHSTKDNDVPFCIAQKLNKEIPDTYIHPVNHSEHVFDKNSQSELSEKVYSYLFDWLKQIN